MSPETPVFQHRDQKVEHPVEVPHGLKASTILTKSDNQLLAQASKSSMPVDFGHFELTDTNQQKQHTWKLPGKDDAYKGWKPGDKFDPRDFEGWRRSVRAYITDFMRLNNIKKDSPAGEAFRNAFQHELAAAAFQKETGLPTALVESVGLAQEFYQGAKDIFAISGAAGEIEAGGRSGNSELIELGRQDLKQYTNQLASMPADTPIDIANNRKGAKLAESTSRWNDLVKKLADSAAHSHYGIGQ